MVEKNCGTSVPWCLYRQLCGQKRGRGGLCVEVKKGWGGRVHRSSPEAPPQGQWGGLWRGGSGKDNALVPPYPLVRQSPGHIPPRPTPESRGEWDSGAFGPAPHLGLLRPPAAAAASQEALGQFPARCWGAGP